MAVQCLLIPRIPVRSFKHLGDLSVFPNLADTCEREECLRGEQSVCGQELANDPTTSCLQAALSYYIVGTTTRQQ